MKTTINDAAQSDSHSRKPIRKLTVMALGLSILLSCFLLPSCTSKAMQRQKVLDKPLDDNYIARIAEIRKTKKQLYGDGVTNAFLYNMDIGVLFHYAEMYDSSNVYLLEAERIFDDLFTKSVSNEAAALLTNDNVRPYRSKPYELTVVHQLVALNFMAMGKFDEALIETRKMQIYFNEWERVGAADKKYHTDGMFHLMSALGYERIGETDNSLISTYQSAAAYKKGPVPLAVEVEGFAYDRLTAGDRENDVSVLNLRPDNGPNKWTAKMGDAEIIIVGYAGKGPKMVEMNWGGTFAPGGNMRFTSSGKNGRVYASASPEMPASHRGKVRAGVHNIKISLPELVPGNSRVDRFSAQLNGNSQVYWSVEVNDIDKQAAKALADDFGAIVARTAIRAIIRTIASDQIQKTDTGVPALNLLKNVGTAIAADQMEKADVRMCFMLPQKIIVTRIPVQPGVHNIQMNVHDKSGGIIGRKSFDNVEVKRGDKKVLFNNYFL
ncbi:hypothetical protein R80B4_00820 [Fibrobacteres bacterium R8-0-B4]